VLAYTAAGTLASSAALTANLPVIGGGAGVAPTVGTRSGNTTAYVTTTGTQTSGDCVKIDANGNHIANGSACGGSSTFDPSTTYTLYEEFDGGFGTSSLTHIGRNAFLGTGTVDYFGDSSRGDVVRLTTTAGDNNASTVRAQVMRGLSWTKDWDIDFEILPGSNSTTIADDAIYVGFIYYDESTTANAAAWVRYDTDLSDSTWVFQICVASGSTGCGSAGDNTWTNVVVSTITPVAGTWNRGRMRHRMSGVGGNETYYFRMGAETEITFCSSGCTDTAGGKPTGSVGPFVFEARTRTTTAKSIDVAYLYVTGTK
jgi:hypothetical protein